MPVSAYRRQVEIPLPLHEQMTAIAEGRGETVASLAAWSLHEYLRSRYPDQVSDSPYVNRDGSLPGPREKGMRGARPKGNKRGRA